MELLLTFGAVVLACVVAVALLRSRRRDGSMLAQPQAMPPMKSSLDSASARPISVALGRELLPLLEHGRTEEAVALLRERMGWSREEAAASVERLEELCKRMGM